MISNKSKLNCQWNVPSIQHISVTEILLKVTFQQKLKYGFSSCVRWWHRLEDSGTSDTSLCDRGLLINLLIIITPTRPCMLFVNPTKAQCCFNNLIGISTHWHISDKIIHQWYIIIILLNLENVVPCFLLFFSLNFC